MNKRDRTFEKRVPLALFIVGAMVGIVGGLLIDICLISFYRWLDFFQFVIKTNPNTFPISLDFWIFCACILLFVGIIYYFYCVLMKFVNPIINQQRGKEGSIDSSPTTTKNEKCFTSDKDEKVTELKSYHLLIECFKDNSTLFSIIAAVATIITLIQVFTVFSLGENWLGIILTGPFGFLSLTLMLISLFGVTLFVYYIEWLILIHFHLNVLKKEILLPQKIEATVFLLVGLFAIACIFVYLVLAWFAKLEFLISILGFFLMIFIFIVPLFIILIGHFWGIYSISPNSCSLKTISFVVIIFLIGVTIITTIPVIQGMSVISDQISKYHSEKTINVGLKGEIWRQDNRTPVIVIINKTNDAYFEKNFTFLDGLYAECRLSTNYGNFITVSSNNSLINRPVQELIVPGCEDLNSRTFWTYNLEDFGKQKPQVVIGLVVRDSIKKDKNSLGVARILLNWTSNDTVSINNNATILDFPL